MAFSTIPLLVRDLMTADVATLRDTDHLDLADDLMRLGRIRHTPVLRGEQLVGIVSQRDLFRAAVSSVLDFRRAAEREWLAKIRVAEVMSHPVLTAEPDWPVVRAVDYMLAKRVGCLPVVEGGHLVGMLSERDCLTLLARLLGEQPAGDAARA